MNDVKTIVENTQASMEKAIAHLEVELQKVRAGKASPARKDFVYVFLFF
jgi:ribosome recycling factor